MLWLTIFDQHFDYFFEVVIEFVKSLALTVGTREAGHIADKQARIVAVLNDSRVGCIYGYLRIQLKK